MVCSRDECLDQLGQWRGLVGVQYVANVADVGGAQSSKACRWLRETTTRWRVARTIIGVTSVAHLDEDVAVWGATLSAKPQAGIDKIRWEVREPAL